MVPTLKELPDALLYVIVGVGVPVADTVYVTFAEHEPVVLFTVIVPGQVTVGAVPVVTTVTVNEQELMLPEASVAVCVTVVVPIGNVEPLA